MRNKILLALIFSFCFIASAFAAGVANNTIGLQESERCSFIGIANDSSSVAHNPAGLTNIANGKIDVELGALYNFTKFTYEDTAGKEYKSDEPIILPAAFAAMSLGNIAFGFGIYVPNGSGTLKFTDVILYNSTFGGNTLVDLKAKSYSLCFAPAVAYKILPNISIGLTLECFYGNSNIKSNTDIVSGLLNSGNLKIDEKTDGFGGVDAKVGLFAKITEALNFGLLVKTPAKLETKGTRETDYNPFLEFALIRNDTSEKVKITEKIPWYFMTGIGYKILPNLDASLDFGYKLWSKYQKIIKVAGIKDTSVEPSVDKSTLKDSYQIGGGVKYGVLPVLDVIAGIMYVPTAKKDKDVSLGETDFAQTITSLSIAYKVIQSIELHLGCSYVHSIEDRNVPAGGKVDSNTIYILAGARGVF